MNERNPSRHQIREAWSFDWPTHGDAAILNREQLDQRTDSVCKFAQVANFRNRKLKFAAVYDWVPGVIQFIRSGHVHGHKLVLCGHSAGASTAYATLPFFFLKKRSRNLT